MCTKRGFLLGFESGLTEAALPIVSTDGIVSSGTPRKNDAATRGGAFNWEANSSSSNVRTVVTRVANGIAWEEYIVEAGISRPGSSLSSFVFIAKDSIGVNRGLTVEMTNAGEIKHYVGGSGSNAGQGTLQGTSAGSALTPSDEYVFISSHIRIASGTDGFMTTFVEDQLQLDTSGIDTVGNTVTALFDSVIGASVFGKMDDIFIRPRCVLIDAVLEAALAAPKIADCAPAVGAAVAVGLLRERGATTTVLMPYAEALGPFGAWFSQLWAESLGKNGAGTTPAIAMGATDQHSQLQLYLDGPRDKMFTLVTLERGGAGPAIPRGLSDDPELAYLEGRSLGDLMAAEQNATADILAGGGHPLRRIELTHLDERVLGGLLMHFMLETLFAAGLMGVDPFGQPAVEDGKQRARDYLEESAT